MRNIPQKSIVLKQEVIRKLLKRRVTRKEACSLLECSQRTLSRYIAKTVSKGIDALEDERGGNNQKLTPQQEQALVKIKEKGPWRSARKALELTGIHTVSERRVQQLWVKHNLHQENVERLKPIQQFVAAFPNDLWQADIQGRMRLPHLGDAYLIATIDDHSRMILGGRWFSTQTQMNVFRVWYHCLFQWGLPKRMLQDKGSQYKAHARYTQTGEQAQSTYQFYAKALGIDLIFAHRAQTKGKIERFWRFVQQDFVREHMYVKSFEELNKAFFHWQTNYNETFKHSGIGMEGRAPAQAYQMSDRQRPKQELQELLIITIRRYVYKDSTISLFGKRYKIPVGYIGCRIWIRIKGEKVSLEAMGKIVYKFRLRA